MKKRYIFVGISVLLAVTLLTAFCASAKPPRKSVIYGALFGVTDTVTTHEGKVVPVSNNRFGVYSDDTLTNCTRVYLYYATDQEITSSLHVKIRLLSSSVTLGTQNKDFTRLCNINSSGSTSNFQSVGSYTTLSVSGTDITWDYIGSYTGRSGFQIVITFQSFVLSNNPIYFELLELSVNGEDTAMTYTDQMLNNMMNYDSQGGSSDTEGASELVESISDDVSNINNTIQQHSPHVQNWFETSPVAGDLVNIALLANSWLPAYLNCDPDVSFFWGLVTFCILFTLIENGLRRRPWHGFDDGGFESEYDVTSTDEKGRSHTIHNKVSGSRRRVR